MSPAEAPKPAPSQPPQRSQPPRPPEPGMGKPAWQRVSGKAYATGGLVLLLIIFVAQNAQEVEVNFIVSTTETPLIFALLIATAFGGLIGWLLPRIMAGGRHRDRDH